MKQVRSDIVMIGAGLTGLALTYFLKDHNLSFNLIEARNRIGGRIHTRYCDDTTSIELGATWLSKRHKALIALLEDLEMETFVQMLGETAVYEPMSINPPQIVRLPPNDDPSYRIKGGSSRVIMALADAIDDDCIYLDQAVRSIEQKDKMITTSGDYEFISDMVLSTLPPYLFNKSIKVIPELPTELTAITKTTHTWMGDSIKVGLSYKEPFWRKDNLSGTIFSNVGPIPEMYDHSNFEDNKYALKGFFNGSYHSVSREERLDMILKQLKKYYGQVVNKYLTYEETVWAKEKYTFRPYEGYVLPHQNGGHPIYQKGYLNNQFYMGGAETAITHSGYMDGAVHSAKYLSNQVKSYFDLMP